MRGSAAPALDKGQLAKAKVMRYLQRFLRGEEAATAVEYAVMLAGIVAVCIAAITSVGGQTFNFWDNNQKSIDTAIQNAHGS